MWWGGDGLMMILMLVVAANWVRAAPQGGAGLGRWLDRARRQTVLGSETGDNIDDDDAALAAYNARLAALHGIAPKAESLRHLIQRKRLRRRGRWVCDHLNTTRRRVPVRRPIEQKEARTETQRRANMLALSALLGHIRQITAEVCQLKLVSPLHRGLLAAEGTSACPIAVARRPQRGGLGVFCPTVGGAHR